jgi:hypothetical protein
MNNELERMWNEALVARFTVLSQLLAGENEENRENLSHDSLQAEI